MKIFICLLVVFYVLLYMSDLKLNLEKLEKSNYSAKVKYSANLGLYLFGFIKIFGINFKEDGIHFLFFKIPYKKIKINKENVKLYIKKDNIKENFKNLNLRLENMNFMLNIGVEDIELTVFLTFIISIILSLLPVKYGKQINMKNYNYEVVPNYNVNTFVFKFSLKMSCKVVNLTRLQIKLKKIKKFSKNTYIFLKIWYNITVNV